MRALATLLTIAIAAAPAAASATELALLPIPETPTPVRYYGHRVIFADAAGLGMAYAVSYADENDLSVALSVSMYLLGGPIVHLAHGQPGRAGGSLALRAALPLLGSFVGASLVDCPKPQPSYVRLRCDTGGILIGGVIGVGTALLVDWTLLAHRSVEERPTTYRAATFTAMPDLSVTPDGDVRVGVVGAF